MHLETKPVSLKTPSASLPTQGILEVQIWERPERLRRALKMGGACFVSGVVSVIFPLVHWVLVPSLILASPVVFYWILNQESVVLGGDAKCPKCAADFKIARGPYRFPMNDVCTNCRSAVKIDLLV